MLLAARVDVNSIFWTALSRAKASADEKCIYSKGAAGGRLVHVKGGTGKGRGIEGWSKAEFSVTTVEKRYAVKNTVQSWFDNGALVFLEKLLFAFKADVICF